MYTVLYMAAAGAAKGSLSLSCRRGLVLPTPLVCAHIYTAKLHLSEEIICRLDIHTGVYLWKTFHYIMYCTIYS